MKRALIVIGVIVGLACIGALAALSLIDWNSYKPEIEQRVEAALGRDVTIAGDLSLGLLPSPRLSAQGISLANAQGGSVPHMATIDALRVRLAFLPLLTGRIQVEALILERPKVILETLPSGEGNWVFHAAQDEASQRQGEGAMASGRLDGAGPDAGQSRLDGDTFRFDSLILRDGEITYHSVNGDAMRLVDLDAEIKAGSLSGPFEAKGSVLVNGLASSSAVPAGFDISLGQMTGDRAIPVAMAVTLGQEAAVTRLSGLVSNLSAGQTFRGKVSLVSDHPGRLLALLAPQAPLPKAAAGKASLEGNMTLSAKEAMLNGMVLQLGETKASGGFTALFDRPVPQLDLALVFSSLDLDPWLNGALAAGDTAPGRAPSAPIAPTPSSGDVVSGEQENFAIPAGLDATLDVSADAVRLKGRVVHDLTIHAQLADGVATLHQAVAKLPAGSEIRANGVLSGTQGKPAGRGAVELTSDNLRGLLDWLEIDVSKVPADRLRRFSASASGELASDLLTLPRLSLAVDTSRLQGSASVRFGDRLGLGIDATIDNLNLDAYRLVDAPSDPAQPASGNGPGPETAEPAAQSGPLGLQGQSGPGGFQGIPVLDTFDANLAFRIGTLVHNGLNAEKIAFDGTLLGGDVAIRNASVKDIAGVTAKVSGGIAHLGRAPRLDEFAFDLATAQPARFFRTFGLDSPVADPAQLGPMAVSGVASGDWAALDLQARLSMAGGGLDADGKVTQGQSFAGAVALDHPDVSRFVRLLSPTTQISETGPIRAAAHVAVDPARIAFTALDGTVGPTSLGGSVHYILAERPRIDADLVLGDVVLDKLMPARRTASFMPLRDMGRGLAVQPAAFRAPPRDAPSPAFTLAATGAPWSSEPLDLSALTAFDGDINVTAQSLAWGDYALMDAELRAGLSDGILRLDGLNGALFDGPFAASGQLNAASLPTVSLVASVAKAQIHDVVSGGIGIDVTKGLLDGRTDLTASGPSMQALIASLTGNGHFAVTEGVINGFDLKAVSRRVGNVNDVAGILGLLQAGLSGGTTRFSSLSGTFTAAKGVVSSQDVKLEGDGGTGSAIAVIDLPAYTIDATAKFKLTGGAALPPIGLRLKGPLDNPRRFIDINDFQAALIGRGVGNLMKGGNNNSGADILRGILGGSQPQPAPQQPEQPDPAPQKPDPEQMIRGLLKEFGR